MNEKIIEKIIEYFKENDDVFTQCIEELDSYNGYLGDDRYYSMDELDDIFSGTTPTEVLARAFYGHDDDNWWFDRNGNKIYSGFNPNREYFYYNGYGNLVSSDCKDYTAFLDHYAIERMSDYRNYVYSIDDNATLSELFDEM